MTNHEEVRVLIVEDNRMISEIVKTLLKQAGYAVVGVATNGLEAVEMTKTSRPDVILMDIEMPDMDGIEATQLIYERYPTPVVILTAYETPDLVEKASEAGVGAYLTKPTTTQQLERAITVAMARFDDIMELRRLNADLQARNEEREKLIAELQMALAKVKTLSGLLPICASCKKIRDDGGYWHQVEVYIRDHSEAEFSHSLCPDCAKKFYEQLEEENE
jgi:AmiR/NasT family two-component response regulator